MTCAIRTYLALGAALTLLGCTAAQAPGPAPAPTPQPARAVPVKELAPCNPHQTQAAYIQAWR